MVNRDSPLLPPGVKGSAFTLEICPNQNGYRYRVPNKTCPGPPKSQIPVAKRFLGKSANIDFSKTKIHFNVKSKKKLIFVLKKEKNDLEETVTKFYPEVKKVINFVKIQNGCYFSRITGSGSACIGIFSSMQAAVFTQKLIKLKFPKYWCVVSKTI